MEQLISSLQRSSFTLFIALLLSTGFCNCGSSPTLVTLIMGLRFAESAYPMAIIVVAITLTSPGIVANNLLRSAGYTGIALKAGACSVGSNINFDDYDSSIWGDRCVSARFIAYFVLMIPLIYKLNRIGGFDFDRIALKFGLIGSCSH